MEDPDDTTTPILSWGGLVGSTVTVLITTLDDSIWLLPFVGTSSLPNHARLVNGVTFLSTLVVLAILCCLVAVIIQKSVLSVNATELEEEELEIKLQWVAVIICWGLAIGFFIKKQLKKRRRRIQKQQQQQQKNTVQANNYGTLPTNASPAEEEEEDDEEAGMSSSTATGHGSRPWTVLSLTTLGFLDEISYFPALIIGNIFTEYELIIGTILAGLVMLSIQIFVANQFKPFIDWLDDHVKLHGIIAIFATILTIQLIWDICTFGSKEEM